MSALDTDTAPAFFSGQGEARSTARSVDWARTPLGPTSGWPRSLQTTVGLILSSRHPMFLWWGKELVQFYNDAYLPSFGVGKHPAAMGQRGRDCWQEIWPLIGPQIDDVMTRGRSTWNEDHLVPIFRNGRIEEVYWTYGYSPVLDETGGVGGTLVVCTETTARVIADRRSKTARSMSEKSAWAADLRTLLLSAAEVLAEATRDIPFALVYFRDPSSRDLRLMQSAGWSDAEARQSADARIRSVLSGLDREPYAERAGPIAVDAAALPGGPWPEPSSSVYVAPIVKSASGEATGLLVFGLSPRLPFDDAYRDHLEQLADYVSRGYARIEASQRLATLLEELEAAARAKDEFLAMLGHELRNPLSPIVTAVQLMKLRGDASTSREQQVIERQVDHLVRLVDDLLDISKITRGKIELRRQRVEIYEVVAKAVEMASVLLEERAHSLTLDVPRSGLLWEGDPMRLAQVVANLLTNAARYTPRGGTIVVFAAKQGTEVEIRVRDNGIGISAEMLPRIFDLFVQGKRSVDRAEGGLGIGLTLVKTLVGLHGGSVSASSEGPSKGSEFVIRLPAAPAGPAIAVETRAISTARVERSSRGKRILVVDDNSDAADLLAIALRHAGHEVEVANDPVVALSAARRFAPEVAILDIGLPGMDGYELGARMRAEPTSPDCSLIALTGYGQKHDRVRSKRSGFLRHLVKPVDIDKLIALLADPDLCSTGRAFSEADERLE